LILRASGWRREYRGRLAPDGTGGFGFVSPLTSVSLDALVSGKQHSARVHLTIPVTAVHGSTLRG
jgi:hypothetical protein